MAGVWTFYIGPYLMSLIINRYIGLCYMTRYIAEYAEIVMKQYKKTYQINLQTVSYSINNSSIALRHSD